MATDYPYTTVTNRIEPLFERISHTGLPSKATLKWLEGIGFKSTNDRTLLRILKFLKFVDSSSSPTQLWKDYRGPNGGVVQGAAIYSSYAELFQVYPNAHQESDSALANLIRSSPARATDPALAVHPAVGSYALAAKIRAVCGRADSCPS